MLKRLLRCQPLTRLPLYTPLHKIHKLLFLPRRLHFLSQCHARLLIRVLQHLVIFIEEDFPPLRLDHERPWRHPLDPHNQAHLCPFILPREQGTPTEEFE